MDKLLDKGLSKEDIAISLDMTLLTLESRILNDNFTDSEVLIFEELKKAN